MLKKAMALFSCLIFCEIAYSQQKTLDTNNNINDWKNKRVYIGVWGGGGLLYDANSGCVMLGLKTELSIAKYFSIEFDIAINYADDFLSDHSVKYHVSPYLNVFTHIPFRFESGFDIGFLAGIFAGHPEYFGGGIGLSLGHKIGSGILFLDITYLHSFYEFFPDGGVNANGYIAKIGYKFGLIKR